MKLNNHYSDEDLEEKSEELEENFEIFEETEENQEERKNNKFLDVLRTLKIKGLKVGGFLFKFSITGLKFTIKSIKKLKLFISTREEKNRLSVEDLFNIYLIHHHKMMLGLAKSYSEANSRVNNKIKKEPSKNADIEDKVKWKTEVAELEKIRDNIYANLKTMASEKIDVDKLDIFEDGYRFGVDCIKKDSKLRSNFIKLNVILFIIFKLLKIDIVLIVLFMLLLNFLSAIMVYNYYINIVSKYLFNSSRAKILIQNQCISAFNTIVSEQKKNLITVPKEDNSFEVEAKSKIEDRTDYSAQQHEQEEVYDNPYANMWKEINDKYFKLDKFKIPEYKKLELIERHTIYNIDLKEGKVIETKENIEKYRGKPIQSIRSKEGKIIVDFLIGDFPNKIKYEESPKTDENSIIIGKSVEGWISLDLKKTPHCMITATTGGGKSNLIRFLFYQMHNKGNWLPYLVDFKGAVDYFFLEDKYKLITKENQFMDFIKRLYGELNYRQELFKEYRTSDFEKLNIRLKEKGEKQIPRIVVIIDEYATIGMFESKSKDLAINIISQLLQRGRSFAINLYCLVQRPDVKSLGSGYIRSLFGCSIIGKLKNDGDYGMAFGESNKLSGVDGVLADKLRNDSDFIGKFVIKGGKNEDGEDNDNSVMVRIPFMDEDDYAEMVYSEWEDNPYADYKLHYSEKDIEDESDEVLNKIHGKGKEDVVEVPYEVIDEVEVVEVDEDDSIQDYFDNLL